MSDSLQSYVKAQQKSFVRALNDPGNFPIGVSDPGAFPFLLSQSHVWKWDPWVNNGMVFVRTSQAGGFAECWAHVAYTRSRKAMLRFLAEQHGVDPEAVDELWHVDYLVSPAFAMKCGVSYVRLCLLSREQVVISRGKFQTALLRVEPRPQPLLPMDYLCGMRALGIEIPQNRNEYVERRGEIAASLARLGVSFANPEGAESALDEYFRWWSVG